MCFLTIENPLNQGNTFAICHFLTTFAVSIKF